MVAFLVTVITYAAQWFVYQKMGRKGWEGIIPLYNTYVLFEVLYENGWSFLKILIPFYGIYVIIKAYIDLAHKFNQSSAFGWGLVLLPFIFMCITAFSKDIQCEGAPVIDPVGDILNNVGVNSTTPKATDADTLIKYKELFDQGVITEDEFKAIKEKILKI